MRRPPFGGMGAAFARAEIVNPPTAAKGRSADRRM
jgi:hypothetical protein